MSQTQHKKNIKRSKRVGLADKLKGHRDVYDVHPVAVDSSQSRLRIQFDTRTLPPAFIETDQFRIDDVWIGTVPNVIARAFPSLESWAGRNGFGRTAIAAEVVLTPGQE